MSDVNSQKARIHRLLLMGPVCPSDYRVEIPRFAARVFDLRQSGLTITTRPCTAPVHFHKSKQKIEYVLVREGTLF